MKITWQVKEESKKPMITLIDDDELINAPTCERFNDIVNSKIQEDFQRTVKWEVIKVWKRKL
jgi:hypothetical protein